MIRQMIHGTMTQTEKTFWLALGSDLEKQSIPTLNDAAKQLVSVTSLLQTFYFAAISFSDIKKGLADAPFPEQCFLSVLMALPLILWLASLAYAIGVFLPRHADVAMNDPEDIKRNYDARTAEKFAGLQRAHRFLVAGFVPLILNVFLYLLCVPLPPPAK